MNNKSKFKKGLKYGAIMIVVGLVMMLIPLDSLFATGTPTPDEEGTGWVKFENNNDVTWTAESGCIITGVEIHAGWSIKTSGRIGNGNYGHIARYELKDGSPTGNPIIYDFPNGLYVPDSTSIPENEDPTNYTEWAYYGDYKVSGVGTQTARVYWNLASGSKESIVHQISWIKFYYTCDQSPVGQITVHKSIDKLVDSSTVFYFELYQGTTLLETKSITGAGSATFDAKLAAGTYTVKETNTGFVTSVSLDGTNFTAGSSIDVAITGDLGSESSEDVYFHNSPEETPETGAIQITKNVTGGLTGTFNFEVKDSADNVVDSPSITINSGESSGSTTITGLAPGDYTVTETGGTASASFTTSPTGSIAVTVVAGQTNSSASFRNDPSTPPPHCEKCSLVVLKRDEAGHPIDGAVFEVNGIQKTITGGEARWDNLECNTTYEVKEISPNDYSKGIHLGDCGERSTMRVVNKIEVGELEVLGIMEVLPFTGPTIPYSPFIGISTVLAGTFLYILSKPKKKR